MASPSNSSISKPFFGPERPSTGPASLPNPNAGRTATGYQKPKVSTFKLGGGNSNLPAIDTRGMSCIDYQVAGKISDKEIETTILTLLKEVGEADEADWRSEFPGIECPTEAEIFDQMIPHIPGETKYFFYSSFQSEKLTLAFKAANYPTYTHFTEVWKDRSWADIHGFAPYAHTFSVRASELFAKRAEGHVVVILPPGKEGEKTWLLTSLWNVELDLLMRNTKVKSIWRVDKFGKGSYMLNDKMH